MEPQTGTASASQPHALFGGFFATKTARDVNGTMAHISPDMIAWQRERAGALVDTPEMFGGELRILAAVDFADGEPARADCSRTCGVPLMGRLARGRSVRGRGCSLLT